MHKLRIGRLNIPTIMVAKTNEREYCEENGIPYIIWNGDDDDLVRLILLPTARKMFPGLDFDEITGRKYKYMGSVVLNVPGGKVESHVDGVETSGNIADIATSERIFDGGKSGKCSIDIMDYLGNEDESVVVEELESLKLMPKFFCDIHDAIKCNLAGSTWRQGYNKKRGLMVGNMVGGREAKNLIIIDVSASIPRGISSSMLALCETLRSKTRADVIITGGISLYYEYGEDMPSPREIREMVPLGNESVCFRKILSERVMGRSFDNVISFGDYDTPITTGISLANTKVGKLWSFHTNSNNRLTGYCMWARDITSDVAIQPASWCRYVK